jgi:DNA gyrase subunit A
VHEIPQGGRLAKGKAIVNMIGLDKGDSISAFVPVRNFDDDAYIMLVTSKGQIKKTKLDYFSNPRRDGIIAMNIPKGDALIEAGYTDGTCDLVLATRNGQAVRFHEEKVRAMGRTAYGVRGINLTGDDYVVAAVVVKRESTLLTVTENGYGKRSHIADYRVTNRGGKGIINIRASERNGKVVAVKEVVDDDELLIITLKGIVNRFSVNSVRAMGRATQGVRLMKLDKGDKVIDVANVPNNSEKLGDRL